MKYSISNYLIAISVLFTGITYLYPSFMIFGMSHYYIDNGNYSLFILQFFTYSFIHGGILHLLFNSIFLSYFGNIVEIIVGKKKYLIFFILNTFFVGISVFFLTSGNTIGISGFCMALLSYFTLELKSKKNPERKGGLTAIILNIIIGLNPQISLVGHLFGAIFGFLFYLFNKDFLNKLMTPVINGD